ncbi:predicted protein [Methanosarcina acetivorans C2A]|uniref:Uncharacterized protein n=1 Tax=Methanosarcina acetivorans (strain ATCC 35395 / DSM 2834 / JCM 12185 / C2A) TaxID=188937 RepID=Q8TIG0_METAC|nr:predicted protein [Methanosarcina acetivorans C2A]
MFYTDFKEKVFFCWKVFISLLQHLFLRLLFLSGRELLELLIFNPGFHFLIKEFFCGLNLFKRSAKDKNLPFFTVCNTYRHLPSYGFKLKFFHYIVDYGHNRSGGDNQVV